MENTGQNSVTKPETFTSKREAVVYLKGILESNNLSVELINVFICIIVVYIFGKQIHYFDQDYILAANCFKFSIKEIRDYALHVVSQS